MTDSQPDADGSNNIIEGLSGKRPDPDRYTFEEVVFCSAWKETPARPANPEREHPEYIGNDGGFRIDWCHKGIGFGQLLFYKSREDGRIHRRNEFMSQDFIKAALCHLVDNMVMDDTPEKWDEMTNPRNDGDST